MHSRFSMLLKEKYKKTKAKIKLLEHSGADRPEKVYRSFLKANFIAKLRQFVLIVVCKMLNGYLYFKAKTAINYKTFSGQCKTNTH